MKSEKSNRKIAAIVMASIIALAVVATLAVSSASQQQQNRSEVKKVFTSDPSTVHHYVGDNPGPSDIMSTTHPLSTQYDGFWEGTTDQGKSVSFNVSEDTVKDFYIEMKLSCATVEFHTRGTFPIKDDNFTISRTGYDEYTFVGTFLSQSKAQGTWYYREGYYGCWGSGTWTAEKKWDPWIYDINGNGIIEKNEAGNAAKDYFDGEISKEQALEVLLLHFATQP